MTERTFAENLTYLGDLVDEYVTNLMNQAKIKEDMASTVADAATIPGVDKTAFVALCRAIHAQRGELDDRITAAEGAMKMMIATPTVADLDLYDLVLTP